MEIPRLRIAMVVSCLLRMPWNQTESIIMTTPARISRPTKTIIFSAVAVACLGMNSCAPLSQSEQDFVAMHGYQRSDYFGSYQNRKFVPPEARAPEYYNHEQRKLQDGRPGYR